MLHSHLYDVAKLASQAQAELPINHPTRVSVAELCADALRVTGHTNEFILAHASFAMASDYEAILASDEFAKACNPTDREVMRTISRGVIEHFRPKLAFLRN